MTRYFIRQYYDIANNSQQMIRQYWLEKYTP